MGLTFEWDDTKAIQNRRKHAISFEEAQTVFADASACIFADEWHTTVHEYRELIIGHSQRQQILIVCFTELSGKTIQIINARKATKKAVERYERHNPFTS